MATKVAKMVRQAEAAERLQIAMEQISTIIGGRPVDLPPRQRDPEMTPIVQLEAFADWAERIQRRLEKQDDGNAD